MRHLDGITVSLRSKGRAVPEHNNPHCKKTNYLHRTIGSRGIALAAGSTFEVQLDIDHNFKLHKAGGIIVVVAFHTDHYEAQGSDFAQVLWIPLHSGRTDSRYTFSETMLWHEGSANTKLIPYHMPAPAESPAQATDDWLRNPVYTANQGCISVHVERGHVDLPRASRVRRDAYNSRNTNVEPRRNGLNKYESSAYPIRLDWFFYLRGRHAEPYVFEFRNLRTKELDRSTAVSYEFGDEVERDYSDSEDGTVNNDDEINISDTEYEGEEPQAEDDELDDGVTLCTTTTTDNGSPVNSTLKQRRSSRARKQINYALGNFYVFESDGETSGAEDDRDEGTLRAQTPRRGDAHKAGIERSHRVSLSTPRKNASMETSSAIKRKLAECVECDEDDEETISGVKPEKSQAPHPSPNSSQDVGTGIDRPSSKRAKFIRSLELLQIRKEELRIRKEEVELLNQLDELDE